MPSPSPRSSWDGPTRAPSPVADADADAKKSTPPCRRGSASDDDETYAPSVRSRHDDDDVESKPAEAVTNGDSKGAAPPAAPVLADQTNYLPQRQVIIIFCALSLGLFISFLDQTSVSTAVPSISASFSAGALSSWLSTSYLVASTAFQPLWGRLSDIMGRKQCMLFSLALFALGSALSASAQSMLQLIIFRAITGIGSGAVQTLVMVIVSDVVSLRDRGKYQGILGVNNAIANSLGPLVGGALSEVGGISWRWIFILVIPILGATALGVICLLPLKPVHGSARAKFALIDYGGTLLTLASTVLLLLALNWGGQAYAWGSPHVLAPLLLSGALFVAFIAWEWKGARLPIMPPRIFANRSVSAILLQTFGSGSVLYVQLFFVPQLLQVVKGYSGLRAGLALIPLMVLQSLFSTISGLFVSRFGRYKLLILAGLALYAVGIGLLIPVTASTSLGYIMGVCCLAGVGAGMTVQPSLIAAQSAVPRSDLAIVTSLRNYLRLLGGTVGLAASFAILNNSVRAHVSAPPSTVQAVVEDPTLIRTGLPELDAAERAQFEDAYVQGFQRVFYFVLACLLMGFVAIALLLRENSLDREEDEELKEEGRRFVQASSGGDVEKQQQQQQPRPADR